VQKIAVIRRDDPLHVPTNTSSFSIASSSEVIVDAAEAKK